MKIAIATAFACGVGVWKRLADEGNDVRVWRGAIKGNSPELLTAHRLVGKGIVPLCDSWHDLLAWSKEGHEPTLMLFDSSGLGVLADDARRAGVHVVGGGKLCDRLEKDRAFGREIASRAGVRSPSVLDFGTLDDTIVFARSGKLDRPVYWKTDAYISGDATHGAETPDELIEYLEWMKTRTRTDIHNILEEKIDGIALSTARWWNGRAWIGPYEWTYERKKFMAGDVGPSTGCSLNAVGFYDSEEPLIAKALEWEAFAPEFFKRDAPPGLYDINAIVKDGLAYFLEWTPRFGWDSEGTSLTCLYDDLGKWLWQVATGQGDETPQIGEIAFSIRLSVPPYPTEEVGRDDKASCVGVPVRGDVGDLWSEGFVAYDLMRDEPGLAVAAAEGIIGLATACGGKVSTLAEDTLSFAKELRVPGLQYRDDAGKVVIEDAERTHDEGFGDIPDGLLL